MQRHLNAASISGNVKPFVELMQKRVNAALEERPVEKPSHKM